MCLAVGERGEGFRASAHTDMLTITPALVPVSHSNAVEAAPLADADAWLALYRACWSASLDALGRHLDAASRPDAPDAHNADDAEDARTEGDAMSDGEYLLLDGGPRFGSSGSTRIRWSGSG